MPSYPEFNKNSSLGDTVAYQGKYYKVISANGGGRTIDLNKPIKPVNLKGSSNVADTINKLRKPIDKDELSGVLQWDFDHPRKAIDATGAVLDKQNVADAVKMNVNRGYDAYVKPAFTVALDMLESLESTGALSKTDLYNILSPKPQTDDPFLSSPAVDAWTKKYDPDYFKGSIHDKDVYSSVKNFKKAMQTKGADFFIARTNINRQIKYDKNGKPIAPAKYGSKEDMLSTVPESWDLETMDKENYASQVLDRIANYAKNNYNLTPVKNAINNQDLGSAIAAAQLYTMNMQDVKDFRIKAKANIIDYMYNNLKDRQDIKEEFGKPIFDENNKFIKYDMNNLKFQLDKSFDAAGNFDPNYIPYTNYVKTFNKVKKHLEKKNKELYPEEFKNSDIPFLKLMYERNHGKPFKNVDIGTLNKLGLKLKNTVGTVGKNHELNVFGGNKTYWEDAVNEAKEYGMSPERSDQYSILKDRDPWFTIAYTPESFGKIFAREFDKAVQNIYTDKGDRNILGLGYNNIPFYDISKTDAGTGIGSEGIGKKIKLSAGKNTDAVVIWNTFVRDWDQDGLGPKINGADRLISFKGFGSDGYEESLGVNGYVGESSEKGRKLINDYIEWLKSNKGSEFDLEAYKYAANNFNKSAMVIRPSKTFLKTILEEEKGGYIDDADYEDILANGVSIIGNQGDFNNELMLAQKTPLQSHVDYRGSYTWRHPSGLASYTIEKGKTGADYITITRYYGFNPNKPGTLKILSEQRNSITNFRENLDKALYEAISTINSDVDNLLNY